MMRLITLLCLVSASLISVAVFKLKYAVLDIEKEKAATNRLIVEHKRALHVLEAEWSHLNQPGYLKKINEASLKYKPLEAQKIVKLETLQMAPKEEAKIISNKVVSSIEEGVPSHSEAKPAMPKQEAQTIDGLPDTLYDLIEKE